MTKFISLLIFGLSLLIAVLSHGYNMLNYPYYENDEGTYFSQAYALGYEGKITHYTYWYDHAPLGWAMTSVWQHFTGGPFAFGYSLYSARIFMLVIHLLSSILIYLIIKHITGKDTIAGLAVVLFSITPLGIYFQRRLLLDNLMTFWLLTSLYILIISRNRLLFILLAGLTFAVAVLTKETAIITLLAYGFMVIKQLHPRQRFIGGTIFIGIVLTGLLYYLLLALLKNELFPGPGHVSLIGTIVYQMSRSNHLYFWQSGSDFLTSFSDWLGKDAFFMIMSLISCLWVLVGLGKSLVERIISAILLLLWLFFIRGGLVINFYIIPAVAFGTITLAITLNDISKIKYFGKAILILLIGFWLSQISVKQWTTDEASPQIASINWVKSHLAPDSVIAVDHAILMDLTYSRFPGDPAFTRAHWFWKLEDDPEVISKAIGNDWQNINYVVLSHEMLKQIKYENQSNVSSGFLHGKEIASWGPISPQTYLRTDQQISTNGDWTKIYAVPDRNYIILQDSWKAYKARFINVEGKITDPQTGFTTSEAQAYGLLRSVIMDDKDQFRTIWEWTKNHLEFRNEDKLFSWKWGNNGQTDSVLDSGFATDADIDIATALVLAEKKWGNTQYSNAFQEIINDIWRQSVVKLNNGRYYLLPGSWADKEDSIIINPSYISPAAYELFADVDPNHNWQKLKTDSYYLLNQLADQTATGLIPDWAEIDKTTYDIQAVKEANLSDNFSFDAVRAYWRVAQDYLWFRSESAYKFLQNQIFLSNYFTDNEKIPMGFTLSGKPLTEYENNAFYGALLPYFQITEPFFYNTVLSKLQNGYSDGLWSSGDNYYTQNWAFLGFALTEGKYTYEKN